MNAQEIAYHLRKHAEAIKALQAAGAGQKPASFADELNAIPGRRVFYNLVGGQDFTATQDGAEGAAITFDISQDGPWIMTHYPLAMWRPNLPTNADNFGRWRPVSHWPLPDQVEDGDVISISWRFVDAGPGRQFQTDSENVPAGMLSMPGQLMELPQPSYFRPNSTISLTPIYEDIQFDTGGTATTGGRLVFVLPGYKIVNLG